jgi:hypothetical protein
MKSVVQFVLRALWRKDVVGIGSLLYGLAVSAMYGDDYVVAGVLYFTAMAWLTVRVLGSKETRDHPRRRGVSIATLCGAVAIFGLSLLWIKHRYAEHSLKQPPPLEYPVLTILHANKELDSQTIDTGGRLGVQNGLVIPTFQIRSTRNVTILGVRLYLSEGDARWDGPWEPTLSDEDDFPAEFYWGPVFHLSPGETWNTPTFTAQRSRGIPWDRTIKGRIKIFYGASAPLKADFELHNNP